MKPKLLSPFRCFLIVLLSACATNGMATLSGFDSTGDIQTIQNTFQSPPMDYAPHAFWFWNDVLDEAVSTRMAREMSRKGMNPGYAHPRHIGSSQGLPVDQWLSEAYFDCFRGVLDVCKSEGSLFGFCDDYWWPSGRLGGRMVTEHPEMRAMELSWSLTVKSGPWEIFLPPNEFIVACQHGDRGIIKEETLQVISTGETGIWEVPEGKWFLYIFEVVPSPGRNRGPDQVLVNYMQPGLAEEVISMGLEPYETHLGEYMGQSLRYCFSDNEGEYGNVLPWSDYMVDLSQDLYGEDIRRLIPLLLTEDEGGTWVRARYQWFNLVAEIYAHHFWKPINDWLSERGLFYVSNFWENDLMLQAATVGDYFRVNRAFSLPGNDALMMSAFDVRNFKEIQSICELERRPFMSEVMGVQGWGQTPAEMKKVANLATAWGVTQIVPHGINLDQDIEKAIHPADWFDQNPYWETMGCWTDFCRRASYINSQGQLYAPVLIYNPMTSIWALSESFLAGRAPRGDWEDLRAHRINRAYFDAQRILSQNNIEYLLADDAYLLESSTDKSGKALELRNHRFDTVVLPPLFAVQTEVYRRLLSFARAGGRILLMGKLPTASVENGADDPVILQMNRELRSCFYVNDLGDPEADTLDISQRVADTLTPPFTHDDPTIELHSTHRIIDGNHFYWLSNNTDRKQSGILTFKDGSGRAEIWDCETGRIQPIPYTRSSAGSSVALDLEANEGFWLVFDASAEPASAEKYLQEQRELLTIPPESWLVSVEGESVPVTTADVWIDGSGSVTSPAGVPAGACRQQSILGPFKAAGEWTAEWISAPVRGPYGFAVHEFEIDEPITAGFLSLTTDGGLALFINGVELPALPNADDWKTPDTVDLLPYLKTGRNQIAVRAGKNLRSGTFWLLAQGSITLQSGETVHISSSNDWFITNASSPDPRIELASRRGWRPSATRPWDRLTWTGRTDVHPPVDRLVHNNDRVWLRFSVPPGASVFHSGIDLTNTDIWLDTHKVKAGGTRLEIEAETTAIWMCANRKDLDRWTKPGSFSCTGSRTGITGSWSDWGMDRYTGFVRYAHNLEWKPARPDERIIIDLGEVNYVAQVLVNGKLVASRMWSPFRFDITGHLRPGTNELTVRVGNLLTNRMAVYDDLNQLETWGNPGRPQRRLLSGGLLDTVRILAERSSQSD